MDAPKDTPIYDDRSARALLERLYYGHSAEVEAILRFASVHKLDDDNYVFLLVAILKGNEELVRLILQAVKSTDQVIDNSRESGKDLRALTVKLIAQIEAAANRSAGHLNVAADRLTAVVRRVDELCAGIVAAGGDLRRVEGVLDHALDRKEGTTALDRLLGQIRAQAQADLRSYHAEIIKELSGEVRRKSWVIHAYGMTLLATLASFELWREIFR